MAMLLAAAAILVFAGACSGYDSNVSMDSYEEEVSAKSSANTPLMVPLTLIQDAAAKGAVCLDGTAPAYHLDPGSGSGANSWLIDLEGGGWCNNLRTCAYRKKTPRGSSNYMEKQIQFTGILSNKTEENPDFFNWNRVKIRYCDGASFTGNGKNEVRKLEFQGQKIWVAAMEELMSKGLRSANQALLSGCSAGGLASILHCDQFRELFSNSTRVKCLSDGGFFMDATDIAGGKTLRRIFQGVVTLQNIISDLKTPLFILNAAYDAWQVISSLAPKTADPQGEWDACRKSIVNCNTSQIEVLQDFRNEMHNALKDFITKSENGIFLNSCFSHCQSELQDTWFSDNSPRIQKKKIATAVGDWYFDRADVKAVDCPYPCDKTCHNLVFREAKLVDRPI